MKKKPKINTAIRLDKDTIERYSQHIETAYGNWTVSSYMRWVLDTHISKEFKKKIKRSKK